MHEKRSKLQIVDPIKFILVLGTAFGISMLLARINDDNNPFAMGVFILAVAVIARITNGYFWGIAASVVGTLCVNYCFTYPFWSFNITYPGYPLTVIVMLVVSMLVSTLTTQIKKHEHLLFEIEREKMHADLLRGISHDIRTPLASIVGASSSLMEQELSAEDSRVLLSEIRQDAEWLIRVTENLLSVTRFSGEDVDLKKDDEVLEEIIGSSIGKYRRLANALPVKVETPDDVLIVPMDAVLIEQVLLNLFNNASEHAVDAGQIWLRVSAAEKSVTISVEDDGKGLTDEELSHLLDGNENTSSRLKTDACRNMGIGLSVCKAIVRAHGGSLTAGRSDHGGAAVRFTLPCGGDGNGK